MKPKGLRSCGATRRPSLGHEGAHEGEIEDEAIIAEQLVEEGVEEADREQRLLRQ